jgi:subtilisin family serine protease
MVLRVGGARGPRVGALKRALAYATAHGARVVNLSFGGNLLFDRALRAAGRRALIVAGAGNDGLDVDRRPVFPCVSALASLLCVGAAAEDGARIPWSNYGRRSVDLAAPGAVVTTSRTGGMANAEGTSMAAPAVAAAAASLWARRPEATVAGVRSALVRGARPAPAWAGRSTTGGLLDLDGAAAALGL